MTGRDATAVAGAGLVETEASGGIAGISGTATLGGGATAVVVVVLAAVVLAAALLGAAGVGVAVAVGMGCEATTGTNGSARSGNSWTMIGSSEDAGRGAATAWAALMDAVCDVATVGVEGGVGAGAGRALGTGGATVVGVVGPTVVETGRNTGATGAGRPANEYVCAVGGGATDGDVLLAWLASGPGTDCHGTRNASDGGGIGPPGMGP